MGISVKEFIGDNFGGLDSQVGVDLRTHVVTSAGCTEVVLVVPNQQITMLGLKIKDLDHPLITSLVDGVNIDQIPYSKMTIFTQPDKELSWVARGFLKEGLVLGFFPDGRDAHVWTLYGDAQREFALRDAAQDRLLTVARDTKIEQPMPPKDMECRIAVAEDSVSIEDFFRKNSERVPDLFDRLFIREAMVTGSRRYMLLVDARGDLAAVAAAEIDHRLQTAAITDCTIRSDLTGRNDTTYLVVELERSLKRDCGIWNLYALVNASRLDMNRVFVKLGYVFSGRLVNHLRLLKGWESLNMWCLPSEVADRYSP
jgi:putative beta-lysine N-acetyltransferase